MKNTTALLIAIALAAIPCMAQLTPSGQSLNASLLYYEPVPAMPGSLLDVFVQIENNGGASQRVFVEFIDNWPFSIDNEADRLKSTGSIPARESFLAKYTVRVSDDATPGTNNIKIRYYSGSEQTAQLALLPVTVYSSSVGLSLENLQVEPNVFVPGSQGTVRFSVHNFAPLAISDGYVKLDLGDLDIIPLESTNQQHFTDLRKDQSRDMVFELIPSPDLEPGVYKIPVVLNFTDQRGNKYTLTETIGIVVGSEPIVSVVVDESQLTTASEEGEVILRVTNQGLGEVKFVNVELVPSGAYKVVAGSRVQYIGNIDSDDYKTARVTLQRTSSAGKEELRLPVKLTYVDALNNPYAREEELLVTVREQERSGGGIWIAFGIVLLAAFGYWLWHRKR